MAPGRLGLLALALTLLLFGAVGGIGYLVYTLNHKAAPSDDGLVAAASVTLSEKEKKAEVLRVETSKADIPEEDTPFIEPSKINPNKVNPRPPAAPPRPVVVHRNLGPRPGPPQAPPPAKFDPPSIAPPKPVVVVAAPKPVEPDGTVLVNEDFSGLEVGSRPKGWVGDAFGVETEKGRRCLEVIKETNTLQTVKLPKATLKGDFEIECEFRLGGANVRNGFSLGGTVPVGHEFRLELTSRSSTPVRVEVDHLGNVRMEAGQPKAAEGFKVFEANTLRLTRKGDVYNVSINDRITVGRTIPRKGAFQSVSLGLTGGKPALGGGSLACLYSVKLTSAEPVGPEPEGAKPDDTVKTPAPAALREDFSRAAVGSLPEGWTASKVANLAVRKLGDSPALELVNPVLGSDQTTLPTVDLKGDFYADVTAVLSDRDTAVEVFFKGPKTRALSVKLDYRGGVTVSGQTKADGSKSWIESKPNVLRIERSGADKIYVIKLNDTAVGSVLLTTAPGPFTQVDLAVIKDVKRESPRITSIEVVPLEEAPLAKP